MNCSKCGAQNPDQSVFCSNCGAPLNQAQPGNNASNQQQSYGAQSQTVPPQQPYGAPQGQYAPPQQPYGAPQGQYAPPQQPYGAPQGQYAPPQQPYGAPQGQFAPPQQPYGSYPGYTAEPALPMNWHKFLVYFALWAGAVINLANAIMVLTGSQYSAYGKNLSELVYAVFGGLKVADIIFGISLLALAAFGIFTVINLLKLKKGAPGFLNILYIASGALNLLYTIAVLIIISDAAKSLRIDTSSIVSRAIVGLVASIVMIIINIAYYKKREHLFVN